MSKNSPNVTWDVVRRYGLEIIVFFISACFAFLDTQTLSYSKYFFSAGGIIIALSSAVFRIKDDVQIKRLFAETKKSNSIIKDSHALIKKQVEETKERERSLLEQNDLITRLIKEGLIAEQSIYEIVQRNRFFYVFCYQNVPDSKEVEGALGESTRNPSLEAVEELGFVKVGKNHNLYVIPYDMLPAKLRDPVMLEKVIRKLVDEHWASFLLKLEQANQQFYAAYKARFGNPTNCTYMIASANFHDVIINYVGYNTFSRKFKDLLQYHVDIGKLRKEIAKRKHDIKEFVQSISYELFLAEVTSVKDKKIIIENEQNIKAKLNIKSFTDYKDKRDELRLKLENLISKAKAAKYADLIVDKSRKYNEVFSLLGIDLK